MEDSGKRRVVLSHEAVPGYRRIFLMVLAAGVIYLTVIFLKTL